MGRSTLDKEKLERKKSEAAGDVELKPGDIGVTADGTAVDEMAVGAEANAEATEMAPVKRKPGRPKKESGAEAGADDIDPEAVKGARRALRLAMKEAVKAECKQIAETLLDKVKCGNVRCAELMMSLIEKKKDGDSVKKKKRDGPSDAELMMMDESEWNAEQARLVELAKKIRK